MQDQSTTGLECATARSTGPKDLGALRDVVNEAHRKIETANKTIRGEMTLSLRWALVAGEALLDAKALLKRAQGPRGRWLPWLEANFEGAPDTAQTYMRLAKRREEIAEKKGACAFFSQREALRLLGDNNHKSDPALNGAVNEDRDSDEWYTPQEYIEAARTVLGEIDLDPASCEHANQIVRAKTFYDKADNGLTQPWHGRVWLNPPFSRSLAQGFSAKLLEELGAWRTTAAILIQNASTDTGWFHRLAAVANLACFTRGRINFYRVDGAGTENRWGQVFFYFGPAPALFAKHFGRFGIICKFGE